MTASSMWKGWSSDASAPQVKFLWRSNSDLPAPVALFQLAANQLPGNRSSMLDSRSTNGSMTLSQSGCGSQAKLDKYNSTYEDLIAGKVANVDPKRLEVQRMISVFEMLILRGE